jgi:ribosomal protein S18 acetylase RimI-like enzyme
MIQQSFRIRPAIADDADRVGQLAKQFAAYLRDLGDTSDFQFDAHTYLRDGFGSLPAFSGIVAEINGLVIGYLLYHPGYDTDRAIRLLHIVDLYVEEGFREIGIGRALMEMVATVGEHGGAKGLIWSVYSPNINAGEFYKRIGARYVKGLDFMYLEIESKGE